MDDSEIRLEIVLPQENILLPIPSNVNFSNGFIKVPQIGDNIYWQSFVLSNVNCSTTSDNKGNIFYFHGYADHTSWYIRDHMIRFAVEGYNVYCADYQGHGKSSGLHGYIRSFKDIVIAMESMGSVVACYVWDHYRYDLQVINSGFGGIVMIAPLCGIDEPGFLLETLLSIFSYWFPTRQFIPQKNLNDKSIKNVSVRENALLNKLYFRQPIRNKTAYEILKASRTMSQIFSKISIFSFLIVHGTDDVITNPLKSKQFYDMSPSLNKNYISYDGVWHSMLSGEDHETTSKIYQDIFNWIALSM